MTILCLFFILKVLEQLVRLSQTCIQQNLKKSWKPCTQLFYIYSDLHLTTLSLQIMLKYLAFSLKLNNLKLIFSSNGSPISFTSFILMYLLKNITIGYVLVKMSFH